MVKFSCTDQELNFEFGTWGKFKCFHFFSLLLSSWLHLHHRNTKHGYTRGYASSRTTASGTITGISLPSKKTKEDIEPLDNFLFRRLLFQRPDIRQPIEEVEATVSMTDIIRTNFANTEIDSADEPTEFQSWYFAAFINMPLMTVPVMTVQRILDDEVIVLPSLPARRGLCQFERVFLNSI